MNNLCEDLFYRNTKNIFGGSDWIFYYEVSNGSDDDYFTFSNIIEIIWTLTPYSVIKEKKKAIITKKMSIVGEIETIGKNLIKVNLKARDTMSMFGMFICQLIIIDQKNTEIVAYTGLVNLIKRNEE